MISAKEARDLMIDDEVFKNKMQVIEDRIIAAAKVGNNTVTTAIEDPILRKKILDTLHELGYAAFERYGYQDMIMINF